MSKSTIITIALVSLAGVGALVLQPGRSQSQSTSSLQRSIPGEVSERLKADEKLDADKVEQSLAAFAKSADPVVQDQVATARMRAGYQVASKMSFSEARKVFVTTQASYKGTGVRDENYGSIPDQAAYQAIVCLQADGKTEEAITEYIKYLKERQSSPLCHGVHRRLMKLAPEREAEWNALLQDCVTKREDFIRLELAMCGPKVLAYLVEGLSLKADKLPGEAKDPLHKRFAQITKTDEEGTTLEQMQSGLKAIGIPSHGMQLNAASFREESTPFIWLGHSHYLLVIQKSGDQMTVFDPMTNSQKRMPVPPKSETGFKATVLIPEFSTYQNRQFKISVPENPKLQSIQRGNP